MAKEIPEGTRSNTAAQRYGVLSADRFSALERARDASKLTIPSLIPPLGATGNTRLPTPYQSIGARGVNNLASKLLLALFPPNQPFFRLEIGDFEVEQIVNGDPAQKAAFGSALSKIERAVQTEIEEEAIRVAAFEAIKHLITGGNVLCYMQPEGGMRVFHLRDYVCRRDPSGKVIEHITRELIAPEAASEAGLNPLDGTSDDTDASTGGADDAVSTTKTGTDKNLELFTWVKLDDKKWSIHQELKGQIVAGSKGTYPLDKSPWLPLRWSRVDGEDYGRGFVEEYQGDLQSLEGLSQAIVEGSAAMAKVLFLVKPNGTTKQKTIANAPNGAVREGNADDVHCLQVEKHADFAITAQTADNIEKRLSFAFMLNSAIQRDAERVTSAEIRYMAQELETSLGGLYSILSQEFQLPLVRRLMFTMQRAKKLPTLPAKLIKPTIVTGMEALGRGNDLDRLNQFMTEISPLGPPVIAQYLIVDNYMNRVATAVGIDIQGLVKPQAQVQQEMQQAQAQQAAQTAVPHLAKAAADGVKEIAVHHATAGQAAPNGATPPPAISPNASPTG